MTHRSDESPPHPRPGWRRGRLSLAGAAGACALGGALGLLARPVLKEQAAGEPPPPSAASRQIPIVVDDLPAPTGAPMDVLPDHQAPPAGAASPTEPPLDLQPPQPPAEPLPALAKVEAAAAPVPAKPKTIDSPLINAAAAEPKFAGGSPPPVRAPRCDDEADPAAALICADPELAAADRAMRRAYRDAQAAGVPEWRLQRQHQRWLMARSAAAVEAPWAVRGVYEARIAELRDMAREALNSDY